MPPESENTPIKMPPESLPPVAPTSPAAPIQPIQPVQSVQPAPLPLARNFFARAKVAIKNAFVRGWLGPFIFFLCVGLLVYSVRFATVGGGSMEPTLHEGQHIVVDMLTYHFTGVHRGDIIIFTNPHDTKVVEVKRVVGLPNEHVLIQGGTIGVTPQGGKYQEFPQGTDIGGNGGIANYEVQLGPEDYFVLGDNRAKSTDSRDFGGVQPPSILGRVIGSF